MKHAKSKQTAFISEKNKVGAVNFIYPTAQQHTISIFEQIGILHIVATCYKRFSAFYTPRFTALTAYTPLSSAKSCSLLLSFHSTDLAFS